jgi:dCMP deaminase
VTDHRASWRDTYLEMAKVLARMRADCTRRKVGAIIFDPDSGDMIEPGYNGAPRGMPGCLSAGACPRGQHYEQQRTVVFNSHDPSMIGQQVGGGECGGCGEKWPCSSSVAPSSSYDTGPGTCIAIHAEANALLRAGRRSRGMVMVVTEKPCDGCMRLCRGARLDMVIWPEDAKFGWERFSKPVSGAVFD